MALSLKQVTAGHPRIGLEELGCPEEISVVVLPYFQDKARAGREPVEKGAPLKASPKTGVSKMIRESVDFGVFQMWASTDSSTNRV